MKRWSAVLLLALAVSGILQAQDPEQTFERANQLYQQNKFADARDAYESLLTNGYESGALYYNLGNAYYKLGNVARAILNYERGLRLIPNDEDLHHNLLLANLMTVDKIEPAPRLFIWDYWDGLKGTFSASEILWLTYTFFVLLFVSLALLAVVRSFAVRRISLVSATAAAVCFLLCLVVCVNRLSDLSRDDYAILTTDIVTIKNSPDAKSTDAFVLHSGIKMQITDHVGEWLKIHLADGKVGWVEQGSAEVI